MFQRLTVTNWRQFAEVDLEFHPRLTILTGANGAGKTTLLHLLNRHWGWNIPYVSTPRFSGKGLRRYWAGFWEDSNADSGAEQKSAQHFIGNIQYQHHPMARLSIPHDVPETFAVQIAPQPTLAGVYVPAHRPLYIHQKVEQIPTNVDARQQIFDIYLREIQSRFALNQKVRSPSHMLKQSLISLATFGYGNEAVAPNADARQTFEGFERVLSLILPPSLGFRKLRVRVPDVMIETTTGDFAFDAVSGGISALIDIAWQVYVYSTLAEEFVVVIDEPEAHLHPALQQSMLPSLLEAFTKAQFVVASHNPFVVGSARDSHVYVLRYEDDRRVRSFLLDQVNKAASANEILRDVLGVRSTTALWVDEELQGIIDRFANVPVSDELLDSLRDELKKLGLDRFFPDTLAQLNQTKPRHDKA